MGVWSASRRLPSAVRQLESEAPVSWRGRDAGDTSTGVGVDRWRPSCARHPMRTRSDSHTRRQGMGQRLYTDGERMAEEAK